jgi:hypothetical protein
VLWAYILIDRVCCDAMSVLGHLPHHGGPDRTHHRLSYSSM